MTRLPLLSVDFDGVLHRYDSGFIGPHIIPDPAVPGMEDFLSEAVKHFTVCIFSSRSSSPAGVLAMQAWLQKRLPLHVFLKLQFPTEKPPAFVTLDDRAITFEGVFPSIETLKAFRPWNRKDHD